MELNNLSKLTDKKLKRVGRGHGSGRGKTSGRGTKGQKARRDIPLHFEGGAVPLIKRLPFLRGKGKNRAISIRPLILNIETLNKFTNKSVVDIASLVKHNIVDGQAAKVKGVKILGKGELSVALTVKLDVSESARKKIEKAGGSVENS